MADSLVRPASRPGETAPTDETSSDSQSGRMSSRRGYSDGRNRFSSYRGLRAECACSRSAMRPADSQRLSVRRWSTGIKVGCPSRFHGPGSLRRSHSSLPSDLRLVSSTSKARLSFSATISTENEVEDMDLLGDPVQMEADGPLLHALVRYVCTRVFCDTEG